jgi:hypothetical protein
LTSMNVGEPMVPPRTPSFLAATDDSLVRSGESAVSPSRARGKSSHNAQTG